MLVEAGVEEIDKEIKQILEAFCMVELDNFVGFIIQNQYALKADSGSSINVT